MERAAEKGLAKLKQLLSYHVRWEKGGFFTQTGHLNALEAALVPRNVKREVIGFLARLSPPSTFLALDTNGLWRIAKFAIDVGENGIAEMFLKANKYRGVPAHCVKRAINMDQLSVLGLLLKYGGRLCPELYLDLEEKHPEAVQRLMIDHGHPPITFDWTSLLNDSLLREHCINTLIERGADTKDYLASTGRHLLFEAHLRGLVATIELLRRRNDFSEITVDDVMQY